MKIQKTQFFTIRMASTYLLAAAFLFNVSCSDDDTDPDPEPEEEIAETLDVPGCDTFTESVPSLNTAPLDFECNGNAFLEADALSTENLNGTWGRFGGADGEAYLKLSFSDNPSTSGVNTSSKVLTVTEDAGIEPWAGFFFNLNEQVVFPSGQEAISVDVYSAVEGQSVLLKLEDKSNSDNFKELTIITTENNAWEKLVFNFSAEDSNKYDRIVFIMNITTTNATEATYHLDNIAFSTPVAVTEVSGPTTAAATPSVDASGVLSVFSDAYTNVEGTDFNPNWGQSTQVTEEVIEGNNTLKYSGLNYQGTAFASALDVSTYTSIHIDYWTADATALNFFLISSDQGSGAVETAKPLDISNLGQWNSVDIALSDFSPVDLADIIQLKVDGTGTVYLDNIYFH